MTADYRRVDGATYLRHDGADTWVAVRPKDEEALSTFCDFDHFVEALWSDRNDVNTAKQITAGRVERMNGADAVKVTTICAQATIVTWVTVESPHVVLSSDYHDGDMTISFVLDKFDEEVTIEAPAADQIASTRSYR